MEITADQIVKLKHQDAATQKLVFQQLYKPMFRICQRYLARIDEAEDCVMKGFLKAFNQLQSFTYEHENSFMFWLKRIMVNESLMALRKQHNLSLASIDEASEVAFEDGLLQQIDAEYLLDAIAKLPTGYRTVLNLFVIEGYSHKEIGKLLSISESTSKTQLAKAKQKLQVSLTKEKMHYGIG